VKSTGAENLVLERGVMEVLNDSKLAILTTTVVVSHEVTAVSYAGHNSVLPSLLANLVGAETITFKNKSAFGAPNMPKHCGAKDVACDVECGGCEGVGVVVGLIARESTSSSFHPGNGIIVAQCVPGR